MDSLVFDPFLIAFFACLVFFLLAIKNSLVLAAIFYSCEAITKTFGKTTINQQKYIYTYQIAWLAGVPIVVWLSNYIAGLIELFNKLPVYLGALSIFDLYLLSITMWYYDGSYKNFRLKNFGSVLLQSLIFLLIKYCTSLYAYSYLRPLLPRFYWFIDPICIMLVALIYVKLNKKTML